MTGLEIIGIISGIASIISIPLAFYFDRKNEINKYENAKRRIIETLLHQIGSGQTIDLLGMRLIIDSKLREFGLRAGRISIQEIIADIYTNVTTNPLIEYKQKSIYQQQIKKLGLSDTINIAIKSISEDRKLPSGEKLNKEVLDKLQHSNNEEKILYLKEHRLLELKNQVSYISDKKMQLKLFMELSTVLTTLISILSLFFYNDFLIKIQNSFSPVLLYVIISALVGLIITLFVSFYTKIRSNREKYFDNSKEYINLDSDELDNNNSN